LETELPLTELLGFVHLFLMQASLGIWIAFLFLILLLIGSALVSGSEVAFFSLSRGQMKEIEEEHSKSGTQLLYLKNRPQKLLATILIANNLINIAIVLVSTMVLGKLLPERDLLDWGQGLYHTGIFNWTSPEKLAQTIEVLIAIVGVTFLLVLFGEVAPKIYAKLNNKKLAKFMSFPLLMLYKLFNPFSVLLVGWTDRLEKRISQSNAQSNPNKEDIDIAIDLTIAGKRASEQEARILKGIIKFNDVAVKQIMCSRVDVVSVSKDVSFKELMQTIRASGYSRIPVFEDDFDHILGILYVKDLLGHLNESDNFDWINMVRDNILYVPESKKINELLKEFQEERLHIAIVVDEYGGSSGIVTLEDVMEEVIGDIKGEFDDEQELEYNQLDEFTFIFEGKTLLNDVCRIIGEDTTKFDAIKGDADSLAGLILEIFGIIPPKGKMIKVDNIKLTVQTVTKRRIAKVKLERIPD
jgi:gliding motility-associated protein GldE